MAGATFELSGGALCLDFSNTWGDRGRPTTDLLRTYPDLVTFGVETGLLGGDQSRLLREVALAEPGRAADVLTRGRELRESLYRIFSAAARSEAPATSDLASFNSALPAALGALRLEQRKGHFEWTWPPGVSLESPLGPILFDAAELLTSAERVRIRECAGDSCTWLFLDSSRNGSRRWCSMQTCGNRAKARRHYRRQQGKDAGAPRAAAED
jgi:predicted RNA-binding Zn ribbon-like protein